MFDRNMTDFPSSLAQLLQLNEEEDSDARPTSLFDLINAHKSSEEEHANDDVDSLSAYALKRLNLKDEEGNSPKLPAPCLGKQSAADDFSTLEEYTRSFMSSNTCGAFLSQKPVPSSVKDSVGQTTILSEKLSHIKICDASQNEPRRIDLTAALSNSTRTTATPSAPEHETPFNETVFYPQKDCVIDISDLADENILYCNNELSHFGYVINKKWNHRPLPKKYRKKIGRDKPYNFHQSFKFDTPSPDDEALKARNRTISNSSKD